ncbi:MAG TPA: hypothetical protein VGY66_37295 [Gemmataceae bacterium]|jgi:uncharacterized repeat protein (TIGR01451 family)|nr:hypothetical protein [Gemmataceae bacterium]
MKVKSLLLGIAVLLACLAGWLVNTADGQPEPQRQTGPVAPLSPPPLPPAAPASGGTGDPVKPPPDSSGPGLNPPAPALGPTKEETDLIRAYQQRYAQTPPSAAAGPAPAPAKPAPLVDLPPLPPLDSAAPAKHANAPAPRPAPPGFNDKVHSGKDLPGADVNGPSNDNPTGRQEPAVSLEWVGPPTAKLGQPVTYQIMVKNICPISVSQVAVRVRIPAGVTVQASEPKALQDAGTLTWDLGTLQPRQERRLDLQLLPDLKGDLACEALVSFAGTSTARIRVREPKLALKAANPDKVLLGDTATISLNVSNPGDGTAEHVKIHATLSDGLEHTRGKNIEFDLGNLGPTETRGVQLVCVTRSAGPQTCEAIASADNNLLAQASAKVDVILPKLDIIAKGPKLRYLDRHAVYTFNVSNPGSAPASNVTVSDVIPDGFKFVSASDGGRHDFATRTVSWFIGDLTPGQSREVSMEAVAIATGMQKHVATVVATRGLKNDTEVQTRVEGLSALLMELVDLDDPVEVGADTAYEIRVTNTGTKTETNLQLICTIPEKMEFRGAKGAADCRFRVQDKEIVFEALPKLAPRADAIYRVNVRGVAPGDLRFRARITADGLTEPVLKEESTKVYGDDVIK